MNHESEQSAARRELLAVLELLLGDGNGPANPETLETLYSTAVAAREYLQAELAAETLDNAAESILAESTESTGPVKDWTYGEIARYLRERRLVLQVWAKPDGNWTARVGLDGRRWTYRVESEPSFQDAIMAVLDLATGRRDANTWRS